MDFAVGRSGVMSRGQADRHRWSHGPVNGLDRLDRPLPKGGFSDDDRLAQILQGSGDNFSRAGGVPIHQYHRRPANFSWHRLGEILKPTS